MTIMYHFKDNIWIYMPHVYISCIKKSCILYLFEKNYHFQKLLKVLEVYEIIAMQNRTVLLLCSFLIESLKLLKQDTLLCLYLIDG